MNSLQFHALQRKTGTDWFLAAKHFFNTSKPDGQKLCLSRLSIVRNLFFLAS
jgi:hypothetical protein